MSSLTYGDSIAMSDDVVSEVSRGLVRRFTDELEGETEFESGTKAAQEHIDNLAQKRLRTRMESYFDDPAASFRHFQRVERVRKKLQQACNDVLSRRKLKKKFMTSRHHAELIEKLEQKLTEVNLVDLKSFEEVVSELKGEWENKHSKAYKNFQKVCTTLVAHKDIFSVFPSQNMYSQALCGALSLVVQASVYHSDYAEKLASSIARLSETAIDCRSYTILIGTDEIQELFAEVYQKLFSFLLEAILWYLKPSGERLLDSFNSTLVDKCYAAVADIKGVVERMDRQATIAQLAMSKWMISHLKEHRARADALEQKNVDFGNEMIGLLNLMAKGAITGTLYSSPEKTFTKHVEQRQTASKTTSVVETTKNVSRDGALQHVEHILGSNRGMDGLAMIMNRPVQLADPEVSGRMGKWIESSSKRRGLLYILSFELQTERSSAPEEAALVAITLALHAEAPFISYVCVKLSSCSENETPSERTGLLVMVYNLIYQLLEFGPRDDQLSVSQDQLDQLNESSLSWKPALELFESLLKHTPAVRYCIIHGLNRLETRGASDWCGEFLNVLVSHFESTGSSLSFLFTTSGQSQELSRRVPPAFRLCVDESISHSKRFE